MFVASGRWTFRWSQLPSETLEYVYVQAVRLPSGMSLVCSEPAPRSIRTNGSTTLLWQSVLYAGESFDCVVEYQNA